MHRRLVCAALAALVVSACSTPTQSEHPEPTQTPEPLPTRGEPTSLEVGVTQGENGAIPPWWNGTHLQAEIPGDVEEEDIYRSEVFWDLPSGEEVRLQEGDWLSCDLVVSPHLGDATSDQGQWQVLWQLHGPSTGGEWRPPPVNLHVRADTWRIGGGAGREDGEESYAEPFVPYVDDRRVHWRIDVLVSEDPDRARVDAWLDGTKVVDAWSPPSGTRYPDHDYLALKSGLYAGTTGGASPATDRRYTTSEPLSCSFVTADGSAPAEESPAG
ncbi:MAG: heparin lyase I family protein [Mobilicoccus sp.]|nr:heparin lyase I family protein [Mobilicoccus sp.]